MKLLEIKEAANQIINLLTDYRISIEEAEDILNTAKRLLILNDRDSFQKTNY